MIKNIVSKSNVPFIDIHKKVFLKEKNPLSLFPSKSGGHYTVQGYKKIAEAIYMLTN